MRLDSVKIRPRLIGTFLIVAMLAGLVGLVGISNIRKIDAADTMLYEHMTVPISQIGDIATSFQKMRVGLRNVMVAQSVVDKDKYAADVRTADAEIDKSSAEFEKLILSDKMREAYKDFETARADFAPYREKLVALALAGKDTEFRKLLWGDAGPKAKAVEAAIDTLQTMKVADAKRTSNENTATANRATSFMVALIIIAMLMAVGLGLVIAMSVASPVRQLADTANKLALGDVDVAVQSKGKDEIADLMRAMSTMVDNIRGQADAAGKIAAGDLSVEIKQASEKDVLAKSMTQVVSALRNLVAEAGVLSKAAVEGKLDTRGNADKFQGGYRDIVQGVNDCLDAVIGPLNVAAEYVDRISNGDIPEKITDNYNGDFNEIKINLNKCIGAVNELVSDANMLSVAAVEGRLDTRADASKHQGDFRKIVQGVDDCLDAVIGPLNVAAEYVERISKGDIPELITDNYNGDFNEIKINLNKCIEAVNALVADAAMLSEAAVEGKLSTRADATKHQGDFRKIVQGVNDCLDAVIKPVNEAADVLVKLADNDLTARVVGQYQGDHAKIKESLNSAMVALEAIIVQANDASSSVATTAKDVAATAQEVGKASQQVAETINQVAAGSQEQTKMVVSASTSMEQLSQAIEEVSKGAQTQAQTVDDTVQLVQQITAAIDTVAKTAQSAAGASLEVADVAKSGGVSVGKSVEGMARIKETSANVAAAVVQLGENSKQIGAIVETIDDIAEQTNLLALNAAIEAARAGEHGKGFAVVADEVRKLAERSSMATKEIADLIGKIQNMTEHAVEAMQAGTTEVETGTQLANQAGEALGSILEAVNSIVRQIEDVSAATEEMSASSAEVARAVESLSAVTEQSTAATEQMAASASEVSRSVEQVAAVSEENAASAEEVSAAAQEQNASVEEMSASAVEVARIADDLQSVVSAFKVDNGRTGGRGVHLEDSESSSRATRKAA